MNYKPKSQSATSSKQSSTSSSSTSNQSFYIYLQPPTSSSLPSMMNYDNEHLEEKRSRKQIPSEDPNNVDVGLSVISSIFRNEKTKCSQLPTLALSLFDFSLSSQLVSSHLPDFDCYQPIILRPPAPLSLQLVITCYCFSREVADDIEVLSAISSLLPFPYETIPPPSKSHDQQIQTCTLLLVRGEGIDSLLERMNRFKIGDLLRTSKKE